MNSKSSSELANLQPIKSKAQKQADICVTLRENLEKARKDRIDNPKALGPRLACIILKKCQKAFYSKLAFNKNVIVPKGKTFEKALTLKMPIFSIVDTPINESILTDRYYVKE